MSHHSYTTNERNSSQRAEFKSSQLVESGRASREGEAPASVHLADSHGQHEAHDAQELEQLLDLLVKASDRSLRDQTFIVGRGSPTSAQLAAKGAMQKEYDALELEKLVYLLGKASDRSLRDQSVIIEGGMQSRGEKVQQPDQHHPLNTMGKPTLRLPKLMEGLISRGRQRRSGGAKRSPTSGEFLPQVPNLTDVYPWVLAQTPDIVESPFPWLSPAKSSFELPMNSPTTGPENTVTSGMANLFWSANNLNFVQRGDYLRSMPCEV